ncbi:hypothetical protein KDA_42280 [Dictyobacter alpinus]|uniref:Uncharacterized protein n=1 Tax=Dictyobacter alpinus TaxID=2014873 RepID=A0A402BBN6_9CHLR|nr:hypothetical protein [Dictyobacter alpinus]GCE28744.1 hypothetical protein KDA_42280 [Dictyobacter alpinus]
MPQRRPQGQQVRSGVASTAPRRSVFSRRNFVIGGVVALGGAYVGGSGLWWSISPQAQIYSGHTAPVNAISWSPDGTRIASGSADNTVQVWDAVTGEHIYRYQPINSDVGLDVPISWSPDSKRIASGYWDSEEGLAPMRDLEIGTFLAG